MRPKIFLGSSSEGIPQVTELAKKLMGPFLVEPWYRDTFRSGRSYLEPLQDFSQKVDYALIVLRPDDKQVKRGAETSSARDNCIFEAGRFISAPRRDRVFLITKLKSNQL